MFYSYSMKMRVPLLWSFLPLPSLSRPRFTGIAVNAFISLHFGICSAASRFITFPDLLLRDLRPFVRPAKWSADPAKNIPSADAAQSEREVQFLPLIKAPSPSPSPSPPSLSLLFSTHSLTHSLDRSALVFVVNGKSLYRGCDGWLLIQEIGLRPQML